MHTAPGHGQEDYAIGQKYGIATYCPVDAAGRFFRAEGAPGYLPDALIGKTVWEGNPIVLELLQETGALLAEACPARIESVEPIPGSHNVKAVVDAGPLSRRTVVCGAPNCRPGLLTAYVPLEKKVVHGVESDGMLAKRILSLCAFDVFKDLT